MRAWVMSIALASILSAGVYDYRYLGVTDAPAADQNNALFYGQYERIIRYDPLYYTPGSRISFGDTFSGEMEKIVQSISAYTQANVPYKVSLIGHTRANKDKELEAAQATSLWGSLQNGLLESASDTETNRKACTGALDQVREYLMEHNVSEASILAECREGESPLFLENDGDAREDNHRVLVALYVDKIEKKLQPAPKGIAAVKTPVPAPKAEGDKDKDGVIDSIDQCPNTPSGYKVDANGCPSSVTLHLNFASSSAVIPQSAYAEIEKLKAFMREFSDYKIQIEGHTDSSGDAVKNQVLSEKRSNALAELLVKEGIASARIDAKGYGETKPVASNMEAAGRAMNRRVEVKMSAESQK